MSDQVTLVLDTNVLLHCRALHLIDWQAKLGVLAVRLVIPWRVYRELDAHASDGTEHGRKRRATERRDAIRDRTRKPLHLKPGVTLEVAASAPIARPNPDDDVLDEVTRQKVHGRTVLVTRDGTMSDSAVMAGLEVLAVDLEDEDPWPSDPAMSKKVHDLTDDVRRMRKELDALVAVSRRHPSLRVVRVEGYGNFVWQVEWICPREPVGHEIVDAREYASAQASGGRVMLAESEGWSAREERKSRSRAAGTKAIEDLKASAARARRHYFPFQLRVHNDGAASARNVRVALYLPRDVDIATRSDDVALRNGDGGVILPTEPSRGVVEPAPNAEQRLVYETVPSVHTKDDHLLACIWLGFSPAHAPCVSGRVVVTADDCERLAVDVAFELAVTEDKNTEQWQDWGQHRAR